MFTLRSQGSNTLTSLIRKVALDLRRQKPRLLVLVCLPRTGSNYLLSTLGWHPQFKSFYELFHRDPEERTLFFDTQYQEGEDPIAFIELMKNYRFKRRVRAVCFKLIYTQALHPEFSAAWNYLLQDPETSFLHLSRRNGLEQYLSWKTAFQSKVWVKTENEYPPLERIHVDPQGCLHHLEQCEKQTAEMRDILPPARTLEIEYESLVEEKIATLNQITSFLELRSRYNRRLKQSTKIQRVGSPHHRITNFEELKRFFSETKYASYFE